MNGPESPVPLTGTNLASFGAADVDLTRCRSCPAPAGCSPSAAPSCSSERSIQNRKLQRALRCGALATWRICRAVRFGIDLCPWSECELSGYDHCFVGLNTAFDDNEISILPLSGFNTNMNGPLWLIWTACDGTSRASLIVSRMKRTRTNSNGQNA